MKLGRGTPLSISELAENSPLTRQAITKHLRVLETAGVVRGERHGRESRFQMLPQSIEQSREALDRISQQWDDALSRLKAFVED
jgi:predicted transcriptional regulator